MIMVSPHRGRHVLPHQDLRTTLLPPDRREPLGGRATTPTGHRYPGAARPTPAVRTPRRPLGLGRPPGPVRSAAVGPRQGATPDHHHPPHRTRPDLRAALAGDGVPAGHRRTPRRAPLRVRRRAGHLPDGTPSPLRT